ncbi:MAG: hypothetical protein AAB513_00120 [Patescibacteria group bacterium]
MKIGFIGQGYIGKNYANDFENRGFKVIRYSLEKEYIGNKEKIKGCDIVFVAVPTPTTPRGFDDSIVTSAMSLIGNGKIAVIKSTLLPGITKKIQKKYPKVFILHSPEFLSRGTASYDAAHPIVNIVGMPRNNGEYKDRAKKLLSILPKSSSKIVSSETSEFFKYVHNTSLFVRGVYMNLLYDLAKSLNVEWQDVKDLIILDPMIAFQDSVVAKWHIDPVRKEGRGIGGNCHIKDFEALSRLYKKNVKDKIGEKIIDSLKKKNISLLTESKKDIPLIRGVYGKRILKK